MTNATVTVLWAWPGTWLHSKSTEASTPPWLADAVMVERALKAKGTSPPGLHFWRRLAELLRRVDGVLAGEHEQVAYATRLLVELAASLPDPCTPDYDPRTIGVVAARRYRPYPAADISACVTLLAAALSDPQPSYLPGVASVLDELAMALLLYPAPSDRTALGVVATEEIRRSPVARSARTGCFETKRALELVAPTRHPSNTRHDYGAPKS